MPRKSVINSLLEKGYNCDNCGLSYAKFMNLDEKKVWEKQHGGTFVPNVCGSKIRKKFDLPEHRTCEHWYDGTETFAAENKYVEEQAQSANRLK